MRKKIIIIGIIVLTLALVNGIIAVVVLSLKTYGIAHLIFDTGLTQNSEFPSVLAVVFAIEFVSIALITMFNWSEKNNTSLKSENENFENTHFLTSHECRKIFARNYFYQPSKKGGILVGLHKNIATLYPLQHTLLLGAQGTGKTVTYVSPQIEIILNANNKPSIIVTDIKGELLHLHGESAKEHGYSLKILNLKDPLSSFKWNPLNDILQIKKAEMGAMRKAELQLKISEEINEVVESLFHVKNIEQSVWEESARDIIKAILYAMTEDFGNGKLAESQFNFVTVADIVSQKGPNCENLKKYFDFRGLRSEARRLSMKALDAVVETRSGFINALENYLAPFADKAIATLVSSNEIDYKEVAIGKTAIFIEISEIASTRHFIATAFLAKLYKELITIADKNLKRGVKNNDVFYLLEEAGNLPAIPKLGMMLSAGRGRGIFVALVIQSYAQLLGIYGQNATTTIRDNIDVEIFIGTSDHKTAEEFAGNCGNSRKLSKSLSRNTSDSRLNINESFRDRPLIYPTELMSLNNPPRVMGNAVVKIRGERNPLKSKYTPYFKMENSHKIYEEQVETSELAEVPFYDITSLFGSAVEENCEVKTKESDTKKVKQKEVHEQVRLSSMAKQIIEKYSGKSCCEIDALIAVGGKIGLLEIIDETISKCERSEKISLISASKILSRGETQ